MPAVTPITEVPSYISPEEHRTLTASTPASFTSIPPVLRHTETNVRVTFDPPLNPTIFGPDDAREGTLYVIESALVFMSTTGKGFQITYPSITLHAILRSGEGPASIYCQLDETDYSQTPMTIAANGAGEGEEEVTEMQEMRELHIISSKPENLEPIFESLSYCASLHPDPNMSEDEDDFGMGDEAFVDTAGFETFNGTDGEELSEVGRAALEHLESIIYDPHELLQEEGENGTGDEVEASDIANVNGNATVNGTSHTVEEGQFSDPEERNATERP
ncbi:uncharacterized protein STEHIDRAFT_153030 [Stereum hirsutum FP-91666 SS1]|uniref:uncharacterized protein n=1 Tax=Stereum hirsutum (strain FP-91666) TaxID=721885 RepID=UPI000440EB59|nr:uncharacterized protein STEHIDRAFT_153030 [Stereum hirsutum FP-91666 SS1]EIM91386.1 hypothetical protein STEHIDRAFT_153030 [Stereum hirsutum FP-91666 SS1]